MKMNSATFKRAILIMIGIPGFIFAQQRNSSERYNNKLNVGGYITVNNGKENLDNKQILFCQSDRPNDFLIYAPPSRPFLDLRQYQQINVIAKRPQIDLTVTGVRANEVHFVNSMNNLTIAQAKFGYTEFSSDDDLVYHSLNIINVGFTNDLVIQADTINSLSLDNDSLQNLDLSKLKLSANGHISGTINGVLNLSGFSVSNNAILNIRGLAAPTGNKINVILDGSDLNAIDVNYSQIQLYFNNTETIDEIKKTYAAVLKKLQTDGDQGNYQKFFIEEKKLLSSKNHRWTAVCVDLISRLWWNYGLDTQLLIFWTMGIFIFFVVINIFFLDSLSQEYSIGNIHSRNKAVTTLASPLKRIVYKFFFSLVYTASIFFGFKIDPEKIAFRKIFTLTYIILQYVFGLICIVYIAHYYFKST